MLNKKTNNKLYSQIRKLILVLLLLGIQSFTFCQNKKFEINSGYGYYEQLSIGAKYCHTDSFKLGISFGTNFNLFNQDYFSVTAENNIAFLRSKIDANGNNKWYLTSKIMYWDMEDPYYHFKILSIAPAITRNFSINEMLYISLDLGPLITIVLDSQRKTFEEVGWPYHIMPNMRVLVNYKL